MVFIFLAYFTTNKNLKKKNQSDALQHGCSKVLMNLWKFQIFLDWNQPTHSSHFSLIPQNT